MKQYLTVIFALVSIGLAIAFIMTKRSDATRHEADANSITDFSNRLDSAQIEIASDKGKLTTLSNNLDTMQSAATTFSNQLNNAQSTIAGDSEQITNLNQKVVRAESENQTLQTKFGQRITDLTNQVTGLAQQLTLTQTNLAQANADYALLENRLRRDVAERLVIERKFNNPAELQGQLLYLKLYPPAVISAESIYAGLDVEVRSNSFHVISPN